jgi:hypothetical protein
MWNPLAKKALSGARSWSPRWGGALLACAFTLAAGTSVGHAQQEYAPDNTEWNGLSELMALAEENHIRIDTPADLDLGALEPTDAIVILFPGTALPPGLGGFMAEGGRVAIADDFGAAGDFLTSFGIRRQPASASGLRGNPNLPIAAPRGPTPSPPGSARWSPTTPPRCITPSWCRCSRWATRPKRWSWRGPSARAGSSCWATPACSSTT